MKKRPFTITVTFLCVVGLLVLFVSVSSVTAVDLDGEHAVKSIKSDINHNINIQSNNNNNNIHNIKSKIRTSSHQAMLLEQNSSSFRQQEIPFARRGDYFTLRVSSASDEIEFEPIEFTNLAFDYDSLKVSHPNASRVLNLTECAIHNCTAELNIEWTMKGQHFATTTKLVHFYAPNKNVKHHLIRSKNDEYNETNKINTNVRTSENNTYQAYIQQTLTLSPVIDFASPLPVQAQSFTPMIESTSFYGPAIYVNNFWQIRDHMHEFNLTNTNNVEELFTLTVDVTPILLWKVLLYEQFDLSMQRQQAMGLTSPQDTEDTKRIFLETNPYFLGLTALVSLLHMIFEYLAFANDVKFWRGRKNFKGLSLRSILINCYFQSIIFLYLLDSQETSWTILLPSGVGVLTEFWKIAQIATITRSKSPQCTTTANNQEPSLFPSLSSTESSSSPLMSDATKMMDCNDCVTADSDISANSTITSSKASEWRLLGYTFSFKDSYDTRTRRYDEVAVRYLIYSMIPILLAYSTYSAIYNTHKSWYSFFIGTQVRFIYFFGFAMMTPQIFINYKMKSVGQMPWRMFVYKALNTVIDDLFAFIIKMPLLHRIACFRDDVVFVILLYQRWLYPVDQTRFGDDDIGGGNNDDDDDNNNNNNGGNVISDNTINNKLTCSNNTALDVKEKDKENNNDNDEQAINDTNSHVTAKVITNTSSTTAMTTTHVSKSSNSNILDLKEKKQQ